MLAAQLVAVRGVNASMCLNAAVHTIACSCIAHYCLQLQTCEQVAVLGCGLVVSSAFFLVGAGQAAQFPKHASAACKQGKIAGKADSTDTVGSLVKAYLAKKPQVVDKILKDEEMPLKSENLFGLAKQVRAQITTHAIRNMTATYMTLPLASVAAEVGLASPEEAANHIYKCASPPAHRITMTTLAYSLICAS